MSDDLEMFDAAMAFFAELRANNSRDWYQERKDHYARAIKAPAEAFATRMSDELAGLTGQPVTPKLFRINRDVRFSKDKTPYNTHLHLMWSEGSGQPAWFFGAAPGEYVSVGVGMFQFDKDQLTTYRAHVDDHGVALQKVLDAQLADGARIGEPELKRVPAPFDKEHPQGDLLRRKGLAVWRDMDEGFPDRNRDLAFSVLAEFKHLLPARTAIAGIF